MNIKTSLANCISSTLRGSDKSVRLIPAGLFRANDGRPSGLPGWILTGSKAAEIIKSAESCVNSLVIDYEHQTLTTARNGQPAPAAGWFKRLEWREGKGLFAVDVQWTERASRMIGAGEYRYISPVFTFNPDTGAVASLVNAAITNNPALDGLVDLAAATRKLSGLNQAELSRFNGGVPASIPDCMIKSGWRDIYTMVTAR
jgi:phage I-like protein